MRGANYSKKIILGLSIFGGIFFFQACGVARWARNMADMSCMGMMMDGDGNQEEDISMDMANFCESSVYLNLREELSLTKAQVKNLKDLSLSCQKEIINKEAEIKRAELDYQSISTDPDSNEGDLSSLEAKSKKIGDLYTQMRLIPVKFREKALGILTEEQKTRLSFIPAPLSEGSHQGQPEHGGSHAGH